jgi:pSer/pThr/pTyr-binding forkhead associated (FHA) protein
MNALPPKTQAWVLEILSGADRGKKYVISKPAVKIGRDTSNHIVLTDLKVSRNHVSFEVRDGKIYVNTLNPKNPVSVDGMEVSSTAEYAPGQVLKMGETTLVLNRQDNLPSRPSGSTSGSVGSRRSYPRPKSKTPMAALVGVLVLMIYLITSGPDNKTEQQFEITTTADIEQIVQESREKQKELRAKRSFASLPERKGFEAAERHYNQGFRDFQRGNYSRAIQSFRAALASDRNHDLAQRYLQLSLRKQQESIDQSLLEGRRHFEKGMYSLCEAAMEKVLIQINDKNDLKYQQAEELRQECFLNKTVM